MGYYQILNRRGWSQAALRRLYLCSDPAYQRRLRRNRRLNPIKWEPDYLKIQRINRRLVKRRKAKKARGRSMWSWVEHLRKKTPPGAVFEGFTYDDDLDLDKEMRDYMLQGFGSKEEWDRASPSDIFLGLFKREMA